MPTICPKCRAVIPDAHQTAAARAPRKTKGKPISEAALAARRANAAKATAARRVLTGREPDGAAVALAALAYLESMPGDPNA